MAKRGRKPSGKRKGYFYEEEEQAIIDYLNSQDSNEKNLIYKTYLMPAFEKMISSIIRRYKLYVPDEDYEQTYNDTLSYLLTKIDNFKPEKGTKAYSYCGTIAKHYLIGKNVQHTKQTQRDLPYNDIMEEVNNGFNYTLEDTIYNNDAEMLIKNISDEIKKMISTPEKNSLNENEIKVGNALVELLDN